MEQDRGSDGRAAPGAGDFSCVIPDMECPDCAAKVERALRAQEGVLEVSVNVMGQTARVRFDPGATDPDGLTSAIREAGYQVRTETGREEEPEAAPFWRDPEKVRTALSGLFFAGGLATGFAFPERDHAPLWQGHLGWPDALFLIAAAVGGYGFLPSGLRALRRLSLDMDFLMTAAILGAAAIGEYAEAAAIAFLFSTAELLEDYAVDRARNSLRSLMKLAPETAVVRRGQEEITVAAEDVLTGDLVVVRPGEKVAVDGEVVEGSSSLDEATITGESMPVAKASGDRVFAGTLNQEGYLEVRATHTGSSSTLARIIRMVAEAEEHRAPSEQFVRRFARYYTPAVTLLAVAVMVLPPFYYPNPTDDVVYAHYKAIADASEIGIMIYNNHVVTGKDLSIDCLMRLAEIENIVALKEITPNIYKLREDAYRLGDRFTLNANTYRTIAPLDYQIGVVGHNNFIGNYDPKGALEVDAASASGDFEKCQAMWKRSLPLVKYVFRGDMYRMTALGKEMARIVGRPMGAMERLPLMRPTEEEREELRNVMIESGVITAS